MITFCNKIELKATFGSATWHQLQMYRGFDYLQFSEYYYRMDGTIYGEDSPAAREAYEKEQAWYLLTKTKRTNYEVLLDLGRVVEEIERDKIDKQNKLIADLEKARKNNDI